MNKYGELLRVVGTSNVFCNGKAHVKINPTGSWERVDVYLKIDHANCVPMQYQKPLTQGVTQ